MGKAKNKSDELAKKEADKPVKQEDAPLVAKPEEVEELERQLAEKAELADAYFAQLQRVQADFENYQKRMELERAKISDSACEMMVSGLLETLDNFERAIAHLEKLPGDEAKGVLMVYRNMLDYLKGSGLERIAAAGCQFDPHKHDAIMQMETDEEPEGTVLEEYQPGYSMRGKVIRPSKVKVARKKNDNNIYKEE